MGILEKFNDINRKKEVNLYDDLRKKAYEMAKKSHDGQKRKSGEDYFLTHPVGVADIITEYFHNHPELSLDSEKNKLTEAVAYMHDVVEDSEKSLDDIEKEFGLKFRNIMEALSEDEELRNTHEKNINITEKKEEPTASEDKNFMKESMLRDSLEKIEKLKEFKDDSYEVAATVRIADIIQNLSDYDKQSKSLKNRNLAKAEIIYEEFKNDINLAQELKDRVEEIKENEKVNLAA